MNKLKSLKIAVGYVRVSTEMQVDNYSLDMQTERLNKFAKDNGIKLVKIFREEGKSGRNTRRPAYQEMMQFIAQNHIDEVLVPKCDRLHRDEHNMYLDWKCFKENGIRFRALDDGVDSESDESHLILAIQAAVAANFSRNLSKETRKGLLAAAELGVHTGGVAPFGFTVNKETGHLEIDPLTAPAVKKIFELYAEGCTTGEISNWLEQNGYKTRNGNRFSASSLNTILKSEKYRGCYTWDRASPRKDGHRNSHSYKKDYVRVPGGCPRIVSDELFYAAQERLAINRSNKSRNRAKRYYPLNGHIFCCCGQRMTGNVQYSNHYRYFQYRCSGSCGNKAVKAELLEEAVFKALGECLFSETNAAATLTALNEISENEKYVTDSRYQQLKSQKHGLEVAQNNLLATVESGKATTVILNRLERNNKNLEQVDSQLSQLKRESHTFTEADLPHLQINFDKYLQTTNTINTKNFLDSILQNVTVFPDQVQIMLTDGIQISRNTKNLFKGEKIMNNTFSIKSVEAILIGVDGWANHNLTLDFAPWLNREGSFTGTAKITINEERFYKLAAENNREVYDLFGSRFYLDMKVDKGTIVGIQNIRVA